VILDNCQRLSIRQQWFRHFQMAGWTTLSNTSLSHYGFIKASDCGSGARSSRAIDATRYGFTDTFSGPVHTGDEASSSQRCILTYTDGPPEWITDERFGETPDDYGLSVRLTNTGTTVTRRYPVAIDRHDPPQGQPHHGERDGGDQERGDRRRRHRRGQLHPPAPPSPRSPTPTM
jgi:hypothetical protein